MIFTSYFAKLNRLPKNMVPIAICGKIPLWYAGAQYKKLAPKYDFFVEWKKNQDNDYYVECFEKEVLNMLDADEVFNDLLRISGGKEFVLVCYEKPENFCHRHLVADWFRRNGYECEEITL